MFYEAAKVPKETKKAGIMFIYKNGNKVSLTPVY